MKVQTATSHQTPLEWPHQHELVNTETAQPVAREANLFEKSPFMNVLFELGFNYEFMFLFDFRSQTSFLK